MSKFFFLPLQILLVVFSFLPGLPISANISTPWLTGSLIAPLGTVIPKGEYSLQPYLCFLVNTGVYTNHWKDRSTPNFYNTTLQMQIFAGITKWMDFQAFPQVLHNSARGQSSTRLGDLPLGFDFQLLSADKYEWFPGIKLGILETFPIGKFQKASYENFSTDISGLGSFSTSISLVFYKVYHVNREHFLSTTFSVQPTFYVPVRIKGLSAYGGNSETRGTLYPGVATSAILSFEYTLNQNWVFAIDNVYLHFNKNHFSGNRGTGGIIWGPSSEQLSFAPAIEYNLGANCGFVAGAWFSAVGRNTNIFRGGIINFVYSY